MKRFKYLEKEIIFVKQRIIHRCRFQTVFTQLFAFQKVTINMATKVALKS